MFCLISKHTLVCLFQLKYAKKNTIHSSIIDTKKWTFKKKTEFISQLVKKRLVIKRLIRKGRLEGSSNMHIYIYICIQSNCVIITSIYIYIYMCEENSLRIIHNIEVGPNYNSLELGPLVLSLRNLLFQCM